MYSTDNVLHINSYEVLLTGIWGRNRKEKFEIVRLKRALVDGPQPSQQELDAAMNSAFAELKVKKARWKLVRRPIEKGEHFESTMLFSEEVLSAGVV